MFKSKLMPILALLAVGGLLFADAAAAPSASASSTLSASDEAQMRETWDTYDVSPDTQDYLLSELEAGRLWDSLNGVEAVSISTTMTPAGELTLSTYPDGSVVATTVEQPVPASTDDSAITPMASVTGCKTISSSSRHIKRQCTISTNVVLASATYLVTYQAVQGGNSTITSHSNIVTECYGGSCSSKSMKINRKTQSGSNPAVVTGYWTWTAIGNAASKDFWLQTSVRSQTITASNN